MLVRGRWLLGSLGLTACAFGGSNDDPTRLIGSVVVDASIDSSTTLDAASLPDAVVLVDSGHRDAGNTSSDSGSVLSCTPRTPAVSCDPVKNTGCPLFTQCDLVPEEATATGRCVFWTPALTATCGADALSETCDAPNACLMGACHKPCYCNSDCNTGQCCKDNRALVPGGAFKICGPC